MQVLELEDANSALEEEINRLKRDSRVTGVQEILLQASMRGMGPAGGGEGANGGSSSMSARLAFYFNAPFTPDT